MLSQIKTSDVIKFILILVILITSIAILYKPHFKKILAGYDNMECYNEVQERNTFKKIIDYKYYSGRLTQSSYFNPIQLLVWKYLVDHYDKNPYPYHLLCVLIHIINTIILFFLLKIFLKEKVLTFLAALSFGVSYLNFQTIGWIAAGIAWGIATFFILSTLLLLIKYFQTKNKFFYLLSLLAFFLGTFTKEPVVFAIPILLAYYLIIQREKILKFIKTDLFILPYLILSLPITLISSSRLESSALINIWGGFNFGVHMLYRFIEFINYLIVMVPVSFTIQMGVAMFILLSFPFLIYYGLKDRKLLFLTIWLVLLISIYIYSNFRNISTLTSKYLYLPSTAWFALLYYPITKINNRKYKILTSIPLIGYTIVLNLILILVLG